MARQLDAVLAIGLIKGNIPYCLPIGLKQVKL